MIIIDDRTPEQKQTHKLLVIATDRFMSGWGQAQNGTSVCGWACQSVEHLDKMEHWIRNRSEMKRVRIVQETNRRYRPKTCAHFHLYVVDENHPGLQ